MDRIMVDIADYARDAARGADDAADAAYRAGEEAKFASDALERLSERAAFFAAEAEKAAREAYQVSDDAYHKLQYLHDRQHKLLIESSYADRHCKKNAECGGKHDHPTQG